MAMRKTEPMRDITERVDDLKPEDNHATVCTVLKWAVRTPGVNLAQVADLCEKLGLDIAAARTWRRDTAQIERLAELDETPGCRIRVSHIDVEIARPERQDSA
jgi:hypothetical protein